MNHPDSIGPYQAIAPLSATSPPRVYSAWRLDRDFSRKVAIYLLKKPFANQPLFQHPSTALLLDAGTDPDVGNYAVAEFIEGLPLATYCERNRLPIHQRCSLFLEVATAVQFGHQHLRAHGRLEPASILVDREGTPKILGYLPTKSGDFNRESIQRDRLALAAILRALLRDLDVHRELAAICQVALKEDGEATVQAMIDDLQRYLAGKAVVAMGHSKTYAARKWLSYHRRWVTVGGLILFTLATLAGQILWRNRQLERSLTLAVEEDLAVRETLNLLIDAFEGADPEIAMGRQRTAAELLGEAETKLRQRLSDQPTTKRRMTAMIEELKRHLGRRAEATAVEP